MDTDDNVFFTQKKGKIPYTQSTEDGNSKYATCTAVLKLPKYSTDASASNGYVDRADISGDYEFRFGIVDAAYDFPADKTVKKETKVGDITYKDEAIEREISLFTDTQTDEFFKERTDFNAFTNMKLDDTGISNAATSGNIEFRGSSFINPDGKIDPALNFNFELTIDMESEAAANLIMPTLKDKIFLFWATFSNDYTNKMTATCFNVASRRSHGVVFHDDETYNPATNIFTKESSECQGKDCPFVQAGDDDYRDKLVDGSTTGAETVVIPCAMKVPITEKKLREGMFDLLLNQLFDINYGINVYDSFDSKTSAELFKKENSLMWMPEPEFNSDLEDET